MFCLIHYDRVIQIEDVSFEVAEPLRWVQTDNENVQVGWTYIADTFQAPE